MASITKLKFLAIGGFVGGAVLTGLAVLEPISFGPNALINASKSTTQLSEDNADSWTEIPGPNFIQVQWSHTLYAVNDPQGQNHVSDSLFQPS
jgi:hypothetical protein